ETRRDVDQAQSVRRARLQRELRRPAAIDNDREPLVHLRAGVLRSFHAEQDDVIAGGVEVLAGFEHDDRAVQSTRQLTRVLHVRVVNERPRARWPETYAEGAARFDRGRRALR